jgi:hypothetical protein
MDQRINYLLELNACLLISYLLYALLLRQETCFRFNRWYLLLTPLLALLVPFMHFNLSPVQLPAYVFIATDGFFGSVPAPATPAAVPGQSGAYHWLPVIAVIYGGGVLFQSGRLLWQLGQIRRLLRHHRDKIRHWRGYWFIEATGMPAFSFFRYLFWNPAQPLDSPEGAAILAHEEAHIRQGHSFDVLYLQVLGIVCWYNPVVYGYQRAITRTHEYLADAQALRTTTPYTYAHLLLNQLTQPAAVSLGNHFHQSTTQNRIHMITQHTRKPRWYKALLSTSLLTLALLVAACQTEEPFTTDSLASDVYATADRMPVFPGGQDEMYKFIGKNIRYPNEAREMGIQGRVLVKFIVDETGKVTDIGIAEDETVINAEEIVVVGYTNNAFGSRHDTSEPPLVRMPGQPLQTENTNVHLQAELIRVIGMLPAFEPGRHNEKPVKVRYQLPVKFTLQN